MISKEYQIVIYGLSMLIVPFLIANILFPIRDAEREIIERVIPLLLACGIGLFGYLSIIQAVSKKGGVLLTLYWVGMSLLFDLMILFYGPAKLGLIRYFKYLGRSYGISILVMGVLVFLFGHFYQTLLKNNQG